MNSHLSDTIEPTPSRLRRILDSDLFYASNDRLLL